MSLEHELKEIKDLKSKKNDLIESFNNISINMITHLGKIFKDSIFYKNRVMLNNFFKFKPNDIIAYFVYYIYSDDNFRKKIKAGDDKFFMEQSYDQAKHQGYELRIFEFKDIWIRMDDSTKCIVKESMRMSIDHAELYLDIISKICKLKKEDVPIPELPSIF